MNRRHHENDDWDDDDPSWDDSDDDSDDGDDDTIPCPHCRRQIHEEAQRCPYCEHYLSDEYARSSPKPWWVIAGALVSLYIVYRWSVGW